MISGCAQKTDKYTKYNNLIDNRKPISWGQDRVVYVFADDPVWKLGEEQIRETLERSIFTNMNESYFEVRRADIKNIDQFFRFRNLIFFGDISSSLPVSEYVKKTLPDTKLAEINKNHVGLFKDENLWANDQQVVFITGDDLHNVLSLEYLQKQQIFQIFEQRLVERTAFKVFQMPVLSTSYFDGFPFTLQVPIQYRVFKKDIPGHFLSFIYRNLHETDDTPDKYVAVYYEKMDRDLVDQNWLIKKRAELAWKYYDEDEFKKEDINITKTVFNNREAWEVYGRWQNKKYKIGGAFKSFAFWDSSQKTAYIIDDTVFYPAGEKLTYLLELEAISKSIKIK
jgi:hypothetical protein